MKIVYPEITWTDQGEISGDDRRWTGEAFGFRIEVLYKWGGVWAGYWSATVNSKAIQTGIGPHGYLFETPEDAKAAVVAEVHSQVDHIVARAKNDLSAFTDFGGI